MISKKMIYSRGLWRYQETLSFVTCHYSLPFAPVRKKRKTIKKLICINLRQHEGRNGEIPYEIYFGEDSKGFLESIIGTECFELLTSEHAYDGVQELLTLIQHHETSSGMTFRLETGSSLIRFICLYRHYLWDRSSPCKLIVQPNTVRSI